MERERYARDAALADMGWRLAAAGIRARRRQFDLFVTPDAEGGAWDGPPIKAERTRWAPSAGSGARPDLAAVVLTYMSDLARQAHWPGFGVPARRIVGLLAVAAAGFGLVLLDARPGPPHAHHASGAIIADAAPPSAMPTDTAIAGGAGADADHAPAAQPSPGNPEARQPGADSIAATPVASAGGAQAATAQAATAQAATGQATGVQSRWGRSDVAERPARPPSGPRVAAAASMSNSLARAHAPAALPVWTPMLRAGRASRSAHAGAPALASWRETARPAPALLVHAMARRPVEHRLAAAEFELPRWLTEPRPAVPRVLIMSPQPHTLQAPAPPWAPRARVVQAAAPGPHPVARARYRPPVYANNVSVPAAPQAYAN